MKHLAIAFVILPTLISVISCVPTREQTPPPQSQTVTSSTESAPPPTFQGRVLLELNGSTGGVLDLNDGAQPKFINFTNEYEGIELYDLSSDHRFFAYTVESRLKTGKPAIIIVDLETEAYETSIIDFIDYGELYEDEIYRIQLKWSPDSRKLGYIYNRRLFVYDVESQVSIPIYHGSTGIVDVNIKRVDGTITKGKAEEYGLLALGNWVTNDCILLQSYESDSLRTFHITEKSTTQDLLDILAPNTSTIVCAQPDITVSYSKEKFYNFLSITNMNNYLILQELGTDNKFLCKLFTSFQEIDCRDLPNWGNWQGYIKDDMLAIYREGTDSIEPKSKQIIVELIDLETMATKKSNTYIIPESWETAKLSWGIAQLNFLPLREADLAGLNLTTILFISGKDPLTLCIGDLESGSYNTLWTIDIPHASPHFIGALP